MARRDGDRPQLDFPQLTADLIDQLQIRGPVGLLDFSDVVSPVFIVGTRGFEVTAEQPVFTSPEMFFGEATAPAAGAEIFTTGGLLAGEYDLWASVSYSASAVGASGTVRLQHLNVGLGFLANLISLSISGTSFFAFGHLPLIGYRVSVGDSIRLVSNFNSATAGNISGVLGLRRRTVP